MRAEPVVLALLSSNVRRLSVECEPEGLRIICDCESLNGAVIGLRE